MPNTKLAANEKVHVQLVITASINGKIHYISSGCEELIGYRKEDLIGTYLKDIIHKDDIFLVESHFFEPNQTVTSTFRLKTSTTEFKWFKCNVEPIYDFSMKKYEEVIIKLEKIVDDLDEIETTSLQEYSNKIEWNELNESEASFLVEEAPVPIIISQNGRIAYVNRAAARTLGVKREDVLSRSIFDFIDEEFHDIETKRIKHLQDGFVVGIIEQKWVRANGETFDVEIKGIPTFYNGRKSEYLVLHDISSRKTFQDVLQKSRERYQRIVQNSIDTIAVIYRDKWVFINDSGVKMFGADNFTEMLGKNIFDFLHPESHQEIRDFIDVVTTQNKEVRYSKQTWYSLKEERLFTEVVGIPTTYFGEPAVQVIIRDISYRKKAEELMLKSEKLSIAGQLAAGIAHEIRNPLTAIKGFLQLFEADLQEKKQYLDIIFSELNRIELILSELLLLAKPTVVSYKKSDVKTLLSDVVTLLDTQAILRNIQIEIECTQEDTLIFCDENQIKQVFINFIKNSIDAMSNGGKIHLHVGRIDEEISIKFMDEGSGIPESILDRIGEPFYTTKEKGTGLGLMVSYNIIENHNGTVSVTSKVNEGTTFLITLPTSN